MTAFGFDDGIIIISSVPDLDMDGMDDLAAVAPNATGIRVVVPMATWIDSEKVAAISTLAFENHIPVSFESDQPSQFG